ncbi:DUF4870 domain-containing protein [Ureibacillus chungkukjangi]|uniref:Uncharacterized protein DUF4870 n=1 Tax=Ureibacillus chungkukjangi TaxID=1202712 RepID=A0A318TS46_9BACL|nr:DUF4870 domain-containing protein [Ureibacillus chungkukjangi]MCM3388533.1 DUF4870 domain-containing protein [Ureibacillus chungkukjangi]PYF05848.1 uncharacterized protein DUF4870 [Ureibacillus chungkukjangi]
MENNKMISALCYVSLLFAPFLLPIIVYFVIKDKRVKYHAKRALLSHSIPTVLSLLLVFFGFIGVFSMDYDNMNGFIVKMFVLMGIYFAITIGVIIWNLVQAYRVFRVGF